MNVEEPKVEGGETQSDFDMEAATAEISSDLFGQGKEEGNVEPTEGQEGASAETSSVEAPPAQEGEAKPAEGENSEAVQEIGAPKTWTKEALEKWATVDPVVKAEIAKREEDFMKGISMYKGAAEIGAAYDQVIEPYRAVLQAENINPIEMFRAFAGNHYLLSRGTPEQKVHLAAELLKGYRIPLEAVSEYMGNQIINPPNPEVETLRREIAELKGGMSTQQRAELERTREAISTSIDSFAEDGKHPYFDEVAEDIARFIESGSVKDLQEAYDKAVWANPATRQKELDRIDAEKKATAEAEAKTRSEKRAKLSADHVETTPRSRNGTVPLGSMDETLEATYREITSRSS